MHAPPLSKSIQSKRLNIFDRLFYQSLYSLFTPSQEVPIYLKSFLATSSEPIRGRPPCCLALDGWSTL
jgi:hypothetical protein